MPPSPSTTVSACLEADHRRLDALMAEVAQLVHDGSFDQARTRFAEFRTGLNRHIDVEEDTLFPAFERETGMTQGPTQVMRMEHVHIRQAMGEAGDALESADSGSFDQARAQLEGVLGDHNVKEERVLYPMCDRALPDGDVRRVVDRVEAGH